MSDYGAPGGRPAQAQPEPSPWQRRRGVVIAGGVAAAVAATLVGYALGGGFGGGGSGATAGPSTSTTPTGTSAAPSASTHTPATSTSKPPSTTPSPTQSGYVQNPTAAAGYDFGLVHKVRKVGGHYVITVDRAVWLTGTAATKYYDAHPTMERLDYAVSNANPLLRDFAIAGGAELYGSQLLGPGNGLQTASITPAQLSTRVAALPVGTVLVWLRHVGGTNGPVTYLAEQYVP